MITLLCSTSFIVCVTAKFFAELDRVALCALQLFLDLNVSSIPLCLDPSTASGGPGP